MHLNASYQRAARSFRNLLCAGFLGVAFSGCSSTGSSDPSAGVPGAVPVPLENPANPRAGTAEAIAVNPRVARLTHLQWENTVRDLFHIDPSTTLAAGFRPDPIVAGAIFDNDARTMSVDEILWLAYQNSAHQIATYLTSDATRLAGILPPTDVSNLAFWDANQKRTEAFIRDVGARAFRRPLENTEVTTYLELSKLGSVLYDGVTEFEGGIRFLIEAFLLSPHFAYRLVLSATAQGNLVPLNPYEVAARLSYTLWDSLPDAPLIAQAASGALATPEGAETQALRMLEDPRARPTLVRLLKQLLEADQFASISPSPLAFPSVGSDLGAAATSENALFLDSTLFQHNGGIGDLLLSTETFANQTLASVYGIQGTFEASFTPAILNPSERRGILTRVGFLASKATSVDPNPIRRGVFVSERLLCQELSVPPGDIPPLPPAGDRTNRERVEAHTEQAGTVCRNCHGSVINPLGFPFEIYDAAGRYRTMDQGKPINPSTEVQIDGGSVPIQDGIGLSETLATSPTVHQCFARHLAEYALQRPFESKDEGLVVRLGEASIGQMLSAKDLMKSVVTSQAFLNNGAETP